MSYFFYVKTESQITCKELIDEINKEQVQYKNNPGASIEFIEATLLYIPFKSTRGVQITYKNGGYTIKFNVLPTGEHYYVSHESMIRS